MRVVVAGGGIGGLALAQGLRRADIDVLVLERDVDLAATGGYRLHLATPALLALERLLPPALLERLYAVSAADRQGIAVRDHRGRLLAAPRPGPGPGAAGPALDVDRVALRLLLADGLDDAVQLGTLVQDFDRQRDRVVVETRGVAGGSLPDLDCDVLVAADGARSAVAARLAGGPTATPAGVTGIAGWTDGGTLGSAARRLVATGSMLAVGPGGVGLYAAWHDPVRDSPLHAVHRPDPPGGMPPARVIWGLIAVDGALTAPGGAAVADLPSEDLLSVAGDALRHRGWAAPQRALIGDADPDTVRAFVFRAADPDRIAPWPAGRITALGDAVHTVPPTGGRGAATAIEDAADLCAALERAAAGHETVPVAVHAYEQRVRTRGAAAVRESLQPLGWIRATATPLGATTTRLALPAAAALAGGVRRLRSR